MQLICLSLQIAHKVGGKGKNLPGAAGRGADSQEGLEVAPLAAIVRRPGLTAFSGRGWKNRKKRISV